MQWWQIMFFFIATILWGLLHAYVGFRLLETAQPRKVIKRLGWAVLVGNYSLTAFAFAGRRFLGGADWFGIIEWGAYVGMGGFVMLWTFVVLRDLLWLGYKLARKLAREEPVDEQRRKVIFGLSGAAVAATALGTTVYGYHEARRLARIKEVEVPVVGLPRALDGFTIVQLSDIHVGPTISRGFLQAVVERANALEPDLIAVTGDLVDGHVEKMAHEVEPLGDLRASHGVFFCTGNHEYYWDGPAWCEHVASMGITVLNNEHSLVEHQGARLLVAGATDYRAARQHPPHASDPRKAIQDAPQSDFKLLLAHQPRSIYEAAEAGFDLQLSGHTHGGQFWPWNVFVGLAHPFTAGLHRFEEKLWIYVSRGTGYWGPPLRLAAPSEITHITLRSA